MTDYPQAKEKLTLKEDGSFAQEVTIKATSEVHIARGSWTYDPKSGYVTFDQAFLVVLNGFHDIDPEYLKPKPGVVVEPVVKVFGTVKIGTDEGILYRKI